MKRVIIKKLVILSALALLCGYTNVGFANGIDLSNGEDNSMLSVTEVSAIELALGEGKLYRLAKDVSSLYVADPSIADMKVEKSGLVYFVPKKIGATNLIALDDSHNIIFNKQVNVGYNFAKLRESIHYLIAKGHVSIKTIGATILLRGTSANALQVTRAVQVIQHMYGSASVINQVKITEPMQISLHVQVVELSRNVTKNLGINWAAAGRAGSLTLGTGLVGGAVVGVTGINSLGNFLPSLDGAAAGVATALENGFHFDAVIDALEQNGLASILAEPNITTLSGTSGSFLAGGEFPIVTNNGINGGTNVTFKQFGVSLNFTPQVTDNDLIRLDIDQEVSSLSNNGSVSIDGTQIPGLTTRRAHVTSLLNSGQSMAIAGLLKKDMISLLSKYPGVGNLPILGRLFRSKQFQTSQTELVIIITPYLVKPTFKTELSFPTDGLSRVELVPAMVAPVMPKYGFLK